MLFQTTTCRGVGRNSSPAGSSLPQLSNRIRESTFDPADTLAQTMRRVYDGLGRLKDNFGAETQKTTHTYDGNEKSVLDPLLHLTAHDDDELDRLQKTTDPDGNEIEFSYDAQDNRTICARSAIRVI